MNDRSRQGARRKELLGEYKQRPPDAGVYRIVNSRTGKTLLGSAMNLASVRSKLEFAHATNTPSALDHRLAGDVRAYGLHVFTFEVLEVLEVTPDRTPTQVGRDLEALEALWRERLGSDGSALNCTVGTARGPWVDGQYSFLMLK